MPNDVDTPQTPPFEPSAEQFLLELLDVPAPSGFEDAAAAKFAEYAGTFGAETSTTLTESPAIEYSLSPM